MSREFVLVLELNQLSDPATATPFVLAKLEEHVPILM
jgi:hypothetical protein